MQTYPLLGIFKKIGFIRVQDSLLETFRKKLNDPDLNIKALYEFECDMLTMLRFQKKNFVLPNFMFKVEFGD